MQNTATAPAAKAAPKKKRKGRSLDSIKSRAGYMFVLPFILGFLIVYLPIIVDSLVYSFNKIRILPGGGFALEFVGLENYGEALFVNPDFIRILSTSIQQLVLDIPSVVIFALFMAVLLNQKMIGRGLFRAIFFIPVIISTGIIDRIDTGNSMLDYMGSSSAAATGSESSQNQVNDIISVMDVARLFNGMKVGIELIEHVVILVNNIYNVVNRSGVQMLIFLAGLQSISPAIYESAFMEGASAWETFWKITFPMISPMILVNSIYTVIDSFTSKQNQVMTLIQTVYDEPGGNVISSAMSWVYFVIVVALIAAVAGLLSAYIFYQRRD